MLMSQRESEMIYETKAFHQIYKMNILLQNTPSDCSTVISGFCKYASQGILIISICILKTLKTCLMHPKFIYLIVKECLSKFLRCQFLSYSKPFKAEPKPMYLLNTSISKFLRFQFLSNSMERLNNDQRLEDRIQQFSMVVTSCALIINSFMHVCVQGDGPGKDENIWEDLFQKAGAS